MYRLRMFLAEIAWKLNFQAAYRFIVPMDDDYDVYDDYLLDGNTWVRRDDYTRDA